MGIATLGVSMITLCIAWRILLVLERRLPTVAEWHERSLIVMREAIRLERPSRDEKGRFVHLMTKDEPAGVIGTGKHPVYPGTVTEPSFEQMQTESIRAQEKYYEPQ